MQLLTQKLTPTNKEKKEPIKVSAKTPYMIIIMVNNNDVLVGTHAGMLMIGPNEFQLFDPSGHFVYPGYDFGSLRLISIDEHSKRADIYNKYLEDQLTDGGNVFVYKFYVTKSEYKQIGDRILYDTSCGAAECTICTSNAITGIGIFKNISPNIRFPSNLKKELDKIKAPLKILKNK